MAVRDWSRFQVLLFCLLWVALTLTGAAVLNLIDVRPVSAQGLAVGLRIQALAWIAGIALLGPGLLTLYWYRVRR
jgi:hypothetical protein